MNPLLRFLTADDIAWLRSQGWEPPDELFPVPVVYRHAAQRLGVTPREAQRMRREQLRYELARAKQIPVA